MAKPDAHKIDADNPELDESFFDEARPVDPAFAAGMKALGEARRARLRRTGGRPTVGDVPKETITLRLSSDVVARLRASGPGYNGRVDAVLRRALTRGAI